MALTATAPPTIMEEIKASLLQAPTIVQHDLNQTSFSWQEMVRFCECKVSYCIIQSMCDLIYCVYRKTFLELEVLHEPSSLPKQSYIVGEKGNYFFNFFHIYTKLQATCCHVSCQLNQKNKSSNLQRVFSINIKYTMSSCYCSFWNGKANIDKSF